MALYYPLFIILSMHNCRFDSLRGYSYKLLNTIINCPYFMNGGIFMPLANSLQYFDGKKSSSIFECKREISAIDMNRYFIAIGEKASPGQLISAVLLDIRAIQKPKFFNYQKTQINFIAVSPDGEFLCSVGSSSEGAQQLNIIEVNNQSEVGTRVMFSKVLKKKDGKVKAIKFSNKDPNFFVLLTASKVILMRIDAQTQSVEEMQMKTSKVRQYNNIIFAPDDRYLYGCSKNGDISEISLQQNKQSRIGPRKRVITKGILNIKYLHPGYLIICGKEGLLALIQIQTMSLIKQIKLQGQEIYSLTEFNQTQCYLSTNKANVYRFDANTFDVQLCYSAHTSQINDLAFMQDYLDLFGTCSASDIILWKTRELKPIIKITLPKIACISLCLPKNGKYIISGWDDDCIRIFSPVNGKLMHKIAVANLGIVTKIISDFQSTKIICGGQNGMIRLWNILQNKMFCLILGSLAFHMKKIHSLKINPYDNDVLVSCGEDGYCAVWSLKKFQLRSSFYVTSFVKQVNFVNEIIIEAVGAGNFIYQCMINNGQIMRKKEVSGNSINCVTQNHFEQTDQKIIVYGGDEPYLNYIEISFGGNHAKKIQSYGIISKMAITCDKSSLIAVTQNGVILKFSIFAIKKKIDEQY